MGHLGEKISNCLNQSVSYFMALIEPSLGDLREKISRERSGQSVSLLNHLKQSCYHEAVSCNVFSINLLPFESLPNCVLFVTLKLQRKKTINQKNLMNFVAVLATRLTKKSSFDWF